MQLFAWNFSQTSSSRNLACILISVLGHEGYETDFIEALNEPKLSGWHQLHQLLEFPRNASTAALEKGPLSNWLAQSNMAPGSVAGNTNRAVYKKKMTVLSIPKWASYHQMQSGQPVLFLMGGSNSCLEPE